MLGKRSRDANVVCLIFAGTRVVVNGKHEEIFCKVHDALSTIVGKMIFIFLCFEYYFSVFDVI